MTQDFIFLSTVHWRDGSAANRPVRFVRELLRRGHRVLYLQAEEGPSASRSENLVLLSLADLGVSQRQFLRAWNGIPPHGMEEFVTQFLDRVRSFESKNAEARTAVWCDPFVPLILPFPQLRARGYRALYDCRDDYEAMRDLGYHFSTLEAEQFLVRESDLVTVANPAMLAKLSSWKPNLDIRLLRQAAELSEFKPPSPGSGPPQDLRGGERTLGFWGLINDFTTDVSLLGYLARAHPNWTINLIGPVDQDPTRPAVGDTLRAFPNIHLLGPKPHNRLVDYLQWFDVTLIPYTPHPFNRAREPIKLYEYLSGYKPVVAANTPYLGQVPYVYLGDTPDSFLEAVESALRTPVDPALVDAYLSEFGLGRGVELLLEWLDKVPPWTPRHHAVEVGSFYPAVSVPANLNAFVEHAEQLLDERTAYISHMQVEWERMRRYLLRLEETHPGVWLERGVRRLVGPQRGVSR